MFFKIMESISLKMRIVGGALLLGMTFLTCADIVGRLFRTPVFGVVELMSFMGALVVALALPDTHAKGGHIGVELLVNRLSSRTRNVIDLFTGILSLLLFSIITWQMLDYARKIKLSGEVSMNLGLPEYMVIFVLGCGLLLFVMVIIQTIFATIRKLRGK